MSTRDQLVATEQQRWLAIEGQRELRDALYQLLNQAYQMQGMFDDEDGEIAASIANAEKTLSDYKVI